MNTGAPVDAEPTTKAEERRVFLFLVVFLAPILSVVPGRRIRLPGLDVPDPLRAACGLDDIHETAEVAND